MAGKLIWSRTLFKICGKQHLFSPPTSKQAMFRLANRVSDKLAWPRSRALNTGAEAVVVAPLPPLDGATAEGPPNVEELLAAAAEPPPLLEPPPDAPAADVVVDGFE